MISVQVRSGIQSAGFSGGFPGYTPPTPERRNRSSGTCRGRELQHLHRALQDRRDAHIVVAGPGGACDVLVVSDSAFQALCFRASHRCLNLRFRL